MINSSENSTLNNLEVALPYINEFFEGNANFIITNENTILKLLISNSNSSIKINEGDSIPSGSPIYKCIEQGKVINEALSSSSGTPIKLISVPVKDENKNVIGSLSVEKVSVGEKLLKSSKNLANSLSEISKVIESVSSGVQNVAAANDKILSEAKDTNEEMQNTDEILTLVESIAKQTNLLGLNAAIEASRAGELGKGFTVVAGEIRKLSSSSSEAIKQINSILSKIKDSVGNVTNNVEETNSVFQTQVASLEEISANLNSLNATAKQFEDIASNL